MGQRNTLPFLGKVSLTIQLHLAASSGEDTTKWRSRPRSGDPVLQRPLETAHAFRCWVTTMACWRPDVALPTSDCFAALDQRIATHHAILPVDLPGAVSRQPPSPPLGPGRSLGPSRRGRHPPAPWPPLAGPRAKGLDPSAASGDGARVAGMQSEWRDTDGSGSLWEAVRTSPQAKLRFGGI
jgi:hypothetical protein